MTNTPSSIVCFKNGFSFVCVPVTLADSSCSDISEDGQVQNCVLGPLPDTVVHGTIGLQPDKPDNLRIISMSRAPTKKQSPSKLNIPQVGEISLWSILSANLNKDVKLQISGRAPVSMGSVGASEPTVFESVGASAHEFWQLFSHFLRFL